MQDLLRAQRAIFTSLLGSTEKLTLLAIVDHWSRSAPRPFPSVARLEAWTGLGRRTILRAVAALESRGALAVVRVAGRPNAYDLTAVFEGLSRHQASANTGATEAPLPVPERHQCQSGTSATEAPTDATQAPTRATEASPPVPERHPKEPIQGTNQGTQREHGGAELSDLAIAQQLASVWHDNRRFDAEHAFMIACNGTQRHQLVAVAVPKLRTFVEKHGGDPVQRWRDAVAAFKGDQKRADAGKVVLLYLITELDQALERQLTADPPRDRGSRAARPMSHAQALAEANGNPDPHWMTDA